MSKVNVLIFTDNYIIDNPGFFLRGSGSYRIATEIRKAGFTCQVIDFFGFMTKNDIEKIIDKYVGVETLIVGIGSTFITKSLDDDFVNNSNTLTFVKNRSKLLSQNNNVANNINGLYSFNKENMKYIFNLCKEKNPKIKFVYGGAKSEMHNRNTTFIDCFFDRKNNDHDIVDYLNNIKNNIPLLTNEFYPIRQFNFVNDGHILWHESDHIFQNEVLPIEIARGCIFKCKFCSEPNIGKKNFDFIKNPIVLKEEFIRNYELFGITNYVFCDSTFNDSTYKLELLYNNVFSKLPFKINFGCYLRLDLLNAHREQIDLLKDMGLHSALYGIEAINSVVLKNIGKTLTLDKLETIVQILKDKWKNKVFTTATFILGLPGETRKSLEEFKKFLINDALNYFSSIGIHPFILGSKSEIGLNPEKYGYKILGRINLNDYDPTIYNINKIPFNWYSKELDLNFSDVVKLSRDLMQIVCRDTRFSPGGLGIIGYKNLGINIEDKNIPSLHISEKILAEKIETYKNKLLN
jgi:hypothetical protein